MHDIQEKNHRPLPKEPDQDAELTIKDPLAALQEKAAENLSRIKLVNVRDILNAFKDKDHLGRFTTSLEIKTEYWDIQTNQSTRSRSRIATLAPEIQLESAGGYLTLILHFGNRRHPDMNRIWNVLTSYGEESLKACVATREIPVLTFTAVPLSLGGNFGMVATDPVFWCLQPSSPFEEHVSQIRILFQPEGVMFMMDRSFQTDEVIAKVKSELASEQLNEAGRLQKELEQKAFQKEREEKVAEYLERSRNRRHTFVAEGKSRSDQWEPKQK